MIVERLTGLGARVTVNDVVPDSTAAAVLPSQTPYVNADTTEEAEVERLLDECEPLPDVVCCHAGVSEARPVQDFPAETFDRILNVNLRAAFLLARAATRRWIAENKKGHLVFTTSWVQDVPWPGIAPYSASKAALKSLTRSFARELAPHQIRANAIAPGIVADGMAKQQGDNEPATRRSRKFGTA